MIRGEFSLNYSRIITGEFNKIKKIIIHPTAAVSAKAKIGANTKIGAFAVIEEDVFIDEDCEIAAHCVVKKFTRLGKRNQVAEHAVLGGLPQDVKFKNETTRLEIGDDNLIREYVTLHRATGENETTRLGSRNFLMVGVHVAHNCTIGDDNVFANGVALAGHIEVENNAFLSSNVGCHQFVRIGKFAMVGGKSKIVQDVLPFFTTDGNPPGVHGLNTVGLRRSGFDEKQRANLKNAYRLLFRSHLLPEDALQKMAAIDDANVRHLIKFIRNSKRGFTRE